MKKEKPRPLVLIEWEDSFGGSGWAQAGDTHALKPARTLTVGWLLNDDKTHHLVAPHLGYGGSTDDGYTQTCGALVIPKSAVRSIMRIKLPKGRFQRGQGTGRQT